MSLNAGDAAPDFTLKDQNGNDVTLSSFRGKHNVVIVFYPFTFTGVCQGELCEIRDDPSAFERADAQVLAISCDTRHAQKQWAEAAGLHVPGAQRLLAPRRGREGVRRVQRGARLREPGHLRARQGRQGRSTRSPPPDLGTPRAKAEYEDALAKL